MTTKKDNTVKIFISIIGIILIGKVLMDLQQIFIPLVIAYLLYFIFEPFNNFLKRKKIPLSIVVIVNLMIIFGVIVGTSQILYSQFNNLSNDLPFLEQQLNAIVSTTAKSLDITDPIFIDFSLSKSFNNLDYMSLAQNALATTVDLFSNFILVLLFLGFILGGHTKIFSTIKNAYIENHLTNYKTDNIEDEDTQKKEIEKIRKSRTDIIENTFLKITNQVQKYIITKTIISIATGIVVGIILYFFDVKYILVWVTLTILLNFIPTIGSILAVIFPTLIAIIQFNSFPKAIILATLLAVVQNVIGNVLEPKIMGDKLGINPLVILISLLAWGYVWGIAGMFLSVPLTAIINIILKNSESPNLNFIGQLMSN